MIVISSPLFDVLMRLSSFLGEGSGPCLLFLKKFISLIPEVWTLSRQFLSPLSSSEFG